jgi:glycine amidinotransferase
MNSPVNSYNEWDPLEEVIVGNGFPEELPTLDFSFRYFFHDNIYGKANWDEPGHRYITKRHVAEHNEDIQEFADLLTSHGITVKRPKLPDGVTKTKTLGWESTNYPALNVRDMTMIIGNEIIETSPGCRWRYFENDYLKHIFLDYFKQGAKWTQSPRPIITDNSFDTAHVSNDIKATEYYNKLRDGHDHHLDCGVEIMYDAANCMRMGRHILFNASNEHDRLGAVWLQRHLGSDYKVWIVNIADSHIDSLFLPIRPGLALITDKNLPGQLPEPLQKWDFVYVPIVDRSADDYSKQAINLASPKVWVNIFSIDDSTIICHTEYYDFLKTELSKYGVNVIPSQIRHCEIFGGGHHCTTIDVRRKGKLENYFNE